MFRRLLRLIRALLPALIVAAAWMAWWVFSDGPIKVLPVNSSRFRTNYWLGATGLTAVRSDCDLQTGKLGECTWHYLDSGTSILPPTALVGYIPTLTSDENTLIARKDNCPIKLFDRTTGRCRGELPPIFPLDWNSGWSTSENLDLLAYGATDGGVVVADVVTGKVIHRFDDLKAPVSLSRDGSRLLAVKGPEQLIIRVLSNGEDVASIPYANVNMPILATISPNGGYVILCAEKPSGDWSVDAWSLTEKALHHLDDRKHYSTPTFHGGRYLMTYIGNRRIWDMASWPPVELTNHFGALGHLPEFSDDGTRVITANIGQREWQLRDTESMSVLCRGPFTGPNDSMKFADHDRWLFLRGNSSVTLPWLHNWLASVTGLQLTPDYLGQFIDVKTGKLSRTIPIDWPQQFTADHSAVWGRSAFYGRGFRYELWSLTPPSPPWWLWALTALGIIALIYNIRRTYWPTADASSKRR